MVKNLIRKLKKKWIISPIKSKIKSTINLIKKTQITNPIITENGLTIRLKTKKTGWTIRLFKN